MRSHDQERLPLDVPFLPDETYLAFLAAQGERILSMHVPLHASQVPDARPFTLALEPQRLAELLALCPGPAKYALINSRFHAPEAYFDAGFLDALASALQTLLHAGQLQGLVYSDHYLLQALSDAHPELCSKLEAVPSVNLMLDSLPKALWHMDYVAGTRFRPPGKLNLDRGLNRRLAELEKLSSDLRQRLPGVRLVLLANEGCLPHCPYKPAHDAHLALAHIQGMGPGQLTANRQQGCTRLFASRPELFFAAPFIRPEDQTAYARVADALKVCGRSRGAKTMQRIVDAYVAGRFEGNLLWLNDTQECLAQAFHVANEELPREFLLQVGDCALDCAGCGVCKRLAQEHVRRLAPMVAPMASEDA